MELSGCVNFRDVFLPENANKPLPQKADGSLLCILYCMFFF